MSAAIYRGPTRGYTLTDDDVLWLARGFVGEGGEGCTRKEASALFWCWMDCFLLVRGRWLQEGWSFLSLLRAHSQPLNPLWSDANSDKCVANPSYCTQDKLARRVRIQNMSIGTLRGYGVYQLAMEAQAGTLERAISEPTYDFAACSLTAKQSRPCAGTSVGGNCFLTYSCLKAGEKSDVLSGEVALGTSVETIGVSAVGLLFGAACAWAVWTLLKKRKKG